MRVLVVASWFPEPPDNGSKLRAFHLVSRLAERHDVTLLSFAEAPEDVSAPTLRRLCRVVKTVPGNPNKAPARLGVGDLLSRTPRSYVRTYSPPMQQLVDEHARGQDCAVALQIGASLYLTRHALPKVFDEAEAGVIRDRFLSAPVGLARIRRGLTWWKLARFLRERVECFDRTTVVSDVERRHLSDAGCDGSKIRVLPNGADPSDLERRGTPVAGRVIYPGAIGYAPNRDAVRFFVDEVLPMVRAQRSDASLVVTGAAGDADTRAFGGAPVTFTGYVPDVAPLIANSWACVVPLRTGGGTRLKILQSMALGTPVVSTTKGAEGLAVTPDRDILIADSPAEFAKQVLRLLRDQDLRSSLAAAGRQLVAARYTWDRVAADFEGVLGEAIDARRRGQAAVLSDHHAPAAGTR